MPQCCIGVPGKPGRAYPHLCRTVTLRHLCYRLDTRFTVGQKLTKDQPRLRETSKSDKRWSRSDLGYRKVLERGCTTFSTFCHFCSITAWNTGTFVTFTQNRHFAQFCHFRAIPSLCAIMAVLSLSGDSDLNNVVFWLSFTPLSCPRTRKSVRTPLTFEQR